jgi:hypothetical protein
MLTIPKPISDRSSTLSILHIKFTVLLNWYGSSAVRGSVPNAQRRDLLASDLKLKLSASIEGGGFNRYAYAMDRQTRLENASDIEKILMLLLRPRFPSRGRCTTVELILGAPLGNLNALARAIT